MEMWRKIEELPGYLVSRDGRIMKEETGEIMSTSKNNGYVRFTITKHVHRLVAQAFLDKSESEEKAWVDHIDGNRSHNNVENLRWVTPSENVYAFGYKSRIKNKRRAVKATHLDGREILFSSRRETCEYFGVKDSELKYNHRYTRNSASHRTNSEAPNRKGWIFEKVEDIV